MYLQVIIFILIIHQTRAYRLLTKTNSLSDCNISHISYNKYAKKTIVYSNQNIDLMDDKGEVINISDYYNSSITLDKAINDIYQSAGYAYLSTGFGGVKLNVANAEISDTYNLGFKVNYSYQDSGYLYAASAAMVFIVL